MFTTRVDRTFRTDDGPGDGRFFMIMRSSPDRMGGMLPGMEGGWWKDLELVKKLHVSDEQIGKIKTISQDHQLQAIDLRADWEKQEAVLGFQMDTDSPDETQVLTQIDKVAQARARLEKSSVQSMLAVRRVLTPEQAKILRDLRPMGHPGPPPMFGHAGGPPPGFGPPREFPEPPRGENPQ
jgi:Spy/CpxP family protein refolding chaperone